MPGQGAERVERRQEVGRRGMSTIVQVIMKWTVCLRFTLKGGVVSWVASSWNLSSAQILSQQIGETSAAMYIV